MTGSIKFLRMVLRMTSFAHDAVLYIKSYDLPRLFSNRQAALIPPIPRAGFDRWVANFRLPLTVVVDAASLDAFLT